MIFSPCARASEFVNQEIRTLAGLHDAQNVIPILIAGIPDNEVTPARQQENAFPSALLELMKMPVAIEYRNFDPRQDRIEKRAFSDSWFTLLAVIYDLSRAEVELREKQRRDKRRRILIASLSVGTLVLFVLLIFTFLSTEARDRYGRKVLYASEMTLARIEFAAGRIARGFDILNEFLPNRSILNADDFRPFIGITSGISITTKISLCQATPAAKRFAHSRSRRMASCSQAADPTITRLSSGIGLRVLNWRPLKATACPSMIWHFPPMGNICRVAAATRPFASGI